VVRPARRLVVLFLLALAPLAGAGCGYRLAGASGDPVPVSVGTLTNDTAEPGVELVLGAALRRELERAGGFRLVERAVPAAYAVRGRVTGVETLGRTFTPGVRALEYTLTVHLELAVTAPGGRPVPLDPFAMRAVDVYFASTDVEIGRKNRDEALRRLAAMLAARIRRELERDLERDLDREALGRARTAPPRAGGVPA